MDILKVAKYTGIGLAILSAPPLIGSAAVGVTGAVAHLGNALLRAADQEFKSNNDYQSVHSNQTEAAYNSSSNSTDSSFIQKLPVSSLYKSSVTGGAVFGSYLYLAALDEGACTIKLPLALADAAIRASEHIFEHEMNSALKVAAFVGGSALVGVTEQTVAFGMQKVGNLVLNHALANYTEKARVEKLHTATLVTSNAVGGLVAGAAAGLMIVSAKGAQAVYRKITGITQNDRSSRGSYAYHRDDLIQDDIELENV